LLTLNTAVHLHTKYSATPDWFCLLTTTFRLSSASTRVTAETSNVNLFFLLQNQQRILKKICSSIITHHTLFPIGTLNTNKLPAVAIITISLAFASDQESSAFTRSKQKIMSIRFFPLWMTMAAIVRFRLAKLPLLLPLLLFLPLFRHTLE
jgi:hypothetical protein